MVTLVSGEKAAAAIKSKVAEAAAAAAGGATGGATGAGLIVTTAAGTTPTPGTPGTPGTPTTVEKRNVAEILASLSGLVPDPVVTATKSVPKAQATKVQY